MKIYNYATLTKKEIKALSERSYLMPEKLKQAVWETGLQVMKRGDKAIKELTAAFDGVTLSSLKVSVKEFKQAEKLVSNELKDAIKTASENIAKFHKSQLKTKEPVIETSKGIECWREFKALGTAGLYVPGGSAPLFSTVLMLAVPAKIAGCKKVYICTPPCKNGLIAPEILFAAKTAGVDEVYKIGGAQAVFAMAYGTQTVPKADKIFGPGNQYVTQAKMEVSSFTAIDMPAGPSEVLIIAEESTNASYAAADILSQAEHGPDSQAVLACSSKNKIKEIIAEVDAQLKKLGRKSIAAKALGKSFIMQTRNTKESVEFSNIYAPEHLILNFKDWKKYLTSVQNAGSVFCGTLATESFGDYASGTNHTLPTSGFAKSFGGLNTQSFGKWITYQTVSAQGLRGLGKTVEIMAEAEGLTAHKNAVTIRIENEK
ncbi:Histidinol dehydrogenase [Elusimicrobium minutum Pei191]|uniref:Histidinol dehydrogenase n=1 Tax=Elusimicrobium minutum (strain Pei191) TaxID=445932 RepID=B2KCM4_ELUMP|nr:histidinol dehydrogenase [Elusimicrobium minutum]ACC98270.1 Histidinol dehydrogenase [Elusimicrobium minutum Pei191]